jgi:hypothetical protein
MGTIINDTCLFLLDEFGIVFPFHEAKYIVTSLVLSNFDADFMIDFKRDINHDNLDAQ